MNTNTTTVPTDLVSEIKPKKQCKKRPPVICSVDGCNKENHAKRLCKTHYAQLLRNGYVGKKNNIEKHKSGKNFSPNDFYFKEDLCFILLKDRMGNVKNEVIIDAEDYSKVKDYHWKKTNSGIQGYTEGNYKGKWQYIHRLIMNPPANLVVDHINHNCFDNRKSNLRTCTNQENSWNRKVESKSKYIATSSYKGVSYRNARNKWRASIQVNKKKLYLGFFKTPEAAAIAYNEAAIKYFGEFACLNEIKKETSND